MIFNKKSFIDLILQHILKFNQRQKFDSLEIFYQVFNTFLRISFDPVMNQFLRFKPLS